MANQPFASHCQPDMLEENFLHSKLAESGGGKAAPQGSSQNEQHPILRIFIWRFFI